MSTKLQGVASVIKANNAALAVLLQNDPKAIKKVEDDIAPAIDAVKAAKKVLDNTTDNAVRITQQSVVDKAVHAAEDTMNTHFCLQQLLGNAKGVSGNTSAELAASGVDCEAADEPSSGVAARLTAKATRKGWF